MFRDSKGRFIKGLAYGKLSTPKEREESLKRWREGTRLWHKQNRERVNEYRRNKRENNPSFKISCNLRKRLSFLVRKYNTSKCNQTMALLGCDMPFFLNYLSSKFKEEMNFSNYGEWHIDHIIPCDSFDLTDPVQQAQCFHYTNLQPLWAKENRVKANKQIF